MKRSQSDLKRNMGIYMLKSVKFVITPAFKVRRADEIGMPFKKTSREYGRSVEIMRLSWLIKL